jgi:hypothetical protein
LFCQLAVNKLGYSRAEVACFLGITSVAFLIGFEDILWGGSKGAGSCWMVVGTM